MKTDIYRKVTIIVDDGIEDEEKYMQHAKEAIDKRFELPLMLHKRSRDSRIIRPTSAKEREQYTDKVPQIDVFLDDCIGKIILPYGTMPEDVTDEDIAAAKYLWLSPVQIIKMEDGHVWIDAVS